MLKKRYSLFIIFVCSVLVFIFMGYLIHERDFQNNVSIARIYVSAQAPFSMNEISITGNDQKLSYTITDYSRRTLSEAQQHTKQVSDVEWKQLHKIITDKSFWTLETSYLDVIQDTPRYNIEIQLTTMDGKTSGFNLVCDEAACPQKAKNVINHIKALAEVEFLLLGI